jgi:hypothetical protein
MNKTWRNFYKEEACSAYNVFGLSNNKKEKS